MYNSISIFSLEYMNILWNIFAFYIQAVFKIFFRFSCNHYLLTFRSCIFLQLADIGHCFLNILEEPISKISGS